MPVSPQKQVANHVFYEGIDTTTSPELKRPTTAEYILNCSVLSQGEGNVGIITNVKGNRLISFDLPEGENKCIGTANDAENNKFYYLLWNSNSLHGLYGFNGLTKGITRYLLNLTDTGNVDIMGLDKDHLVLHFDIVDGDKAYWVDGLNNARKTNLNKLLDKSSTGYGSVILQQFIDQYKQTAIYPPTVVYFSDTEKPFNRLYGAIRKFAVRFIYDDNEVSSWSDFSKVALPLYEPFTGVNTIPTDNNGIKVTVETGSKIVKQIEIGMQSTSAEANNVSILNWVSIAVLDKGQLSIPDNSTYTYNFYNDGNYAVVDQAKVIQPYSFMLKRPLCQAVTKNALIHANGYEGFPVVDIDVDIEVTYEDLFIDEGTENEFNEPDFISTADDYDYVEQHKNVTFYNGVVSMIPTFQGGIRFTKITMTIGNDVKAGNIFSFYLNNSHDPDFINFNVEATNTDTAVTIASKIKNLLIGTNRIYRKTPDLPDSNIYDNTIVGGNVTFSFIVRPTRKENSYSVVSSVNPVQFDTLKDTGQSVSTQKLGGAVKYAITYQDEGRKSLGYTDDSMIVPIDTINELGGFKKVIRTFTINHRPPKEARYWQIVRSLDLVYGSYIQMLIQSVIDYTPEDEQDYLDLLVGSLFTYQKIHPNTSLAYEFSKGDRIRFIKKVDTDTYYDFFETEVIAYNPTTTETINDNLVTTGSATVTVTESSTENIGKFIQVDGIEREIVGADEGAHTYDLNNVIGDSTPKTYLNYELIDRRGTIRIRKPSSITIEDNSTVEIYKPSGLSNPLGSKQFYEFQKKFPIINPGTDEAYHGGDIQDQSAVQPAVVQVSEGTAYVRNREMPVNNVFPGTQLVVQPIESDSFSDFYESLMNDNGRVTAEDNGAGEVHFEDRIRFSNTKIEDTKINGFSDFENLDREDYNDQYGAIMLTKFDTNRIYVFKQLKTAFVPVDSVITQTNNGISLDVNSNKFLNPIQYFAWEGGIGNNPESYSSNGTAKYWVSANSGVIIRLGGNGEEPLSKTYSLDNEVKNLLTDAVNNKAKIFGGFDRKNGVYVITIEGYNRYIYFDGFNGWITEDDDLPDTTVFEIVTPPSHGSAILSGFNITYTPTTDYIGSDTFSYRAFIDGVWSSPKNVCLTITDVPVNLLWRQKESSAFCVLDEDDHQTGYKGWTTLEQYNSYDNVVTGIEKPNDVSDPNYVAPIYDPATCTPELVGNEERSQTFQRDNCGAGETGTYYDYVVPADTYFAADLAAANALADADIAANGQNEANLNAICIPDDTISILVVDVYDDANLDCCFYINTPGITQSNNIVATALKTGGQNFYLPSDPADDAFMLASDLVSDITLKWRFQGNIGKLLTLYTDDVAIPEFIFELRGRSTVSGAQNGQYALKNPDQTMGMSGTPGSYIPIVTPGGGPVPIIWNGTAPSGADGTVGVAIGDVIATFTYVRSSNTIVVT